MEISGNLSTGKATGAHLTWAPGQGLCQVRNNMKTTVHVNDCKFINQDNDEIANIDCRIDSNKA